MVLKLLKEKVTSLKKNETPIEEPYIYLDSGNVRVGDSNTPSCGDISPLFPPFFILCIQKLRLA